MIGRHQLIMVLLIGLVFLSACGGAGSEVEQTTFPYDDLSEEAYVANAQKTWEALSAYLESSQAEDFEAAFDGFSASQGEATPEDWTASEMVVAYQDYLLDRSGETIESFDAMPEEEKAALQEKNRQDLDRDIPNALKVQQEGLQAANQDDAILGTMEFKGQKRVTVYRDGTIGTSPL